MDLDVTKNVLQDTGWDGTGQEKHRPAGLWYVHKSQIITKIWIYKQNEYY